MEPAAVIRRYLEVNTQVEHCKDYRHAQFVLYHLRIAGATTHPYMVCHVDLNKGGTHSSVNGDAWGGPVAWSLDQLHSATKLAYFSSKAIAPPASLPPMKPSPLAVNPGISPVIDAAIAGMKAGATAALAFASLVPGREKTLKGLKFVSAVSLQLDASSNLSLEDLVELFSDRSQLTGFRTLYVTMADPQGLVPRLLEAQPPYLRHVQLVFGEPSDDYLKRVFAAAIASPCLETVEVMWALTNRTWMALPHDYRPGTDEQVPVAFVFHSPTAGTRMIRRTVPLVKVVDFALAGNCRRDASAPDARTVMLRIHGVDSPPLWLDQLRFAELLKVAQESVDAAVDVLFHVDADGVITLPSKYVNSSGEEDAEDRYGYSDVAVLVRWMNDFASDEVHAMLMTDPVAANEPSPYFVSLVGFEFFKEFICVPGRRPVDNLRRTIKVLAAAHFLGVATLANLLMSILNAPHAQSLLFDKP